MKISFEDFDLPEDELCDLGDVDFDNLPFVIKSLLVKSPATRENINSIKAYIIRWRLIKK
jgi:hypothetical protein